MGQPGTDLGQPQSWRVDPGFLPRTGSQIHLHAILQSRRTITMGILKFATGSGLHDIWKTWRFFCSFRFFLGGKTHFLLLLLVIWNHNSYFTVHVTWFFVNPLLLVFFNWSFQDRLSHHPRYGDPELQRPALNGTVFFAGTETARRHGGAIVEKCEASYCRCFFQSNHLEAL